MASTPFDSLDDYIALPRIEALALSPDGERVVLTVAVLKKDGTAYERSLWSVPSDGSGSPKRLTRSAKGEAGAAFTASGDILFVSARPDADGEADDESGQLWLLPATGGEARAVTRLAGGAGQIAATAEASDRVVIGADLLPGADTLEAEAKLRKLRKDKKVSAILHDAYPVRFWDHDLGPAEPHLLAIDLDALEDTIAAAVADAAAAETDAATDASDEADAPTPRRRERRRRRGRRLAVPRDPAPPARPDPRAAPHDRSRPGRAHTGRRDRDRRRQRVASSATDASRSCRSTSRAARGPPSSTRRTSTSRRRRSATTARGSRTSAPRGARPRARPTPSCGRPASTAATRAVSPSGWDRWATSFVFDCDDAALIATADSDGRGPVYRVPLDGSAPEQLTHDDFTYTNVAVDRRTGDLVALRSSWIAPSHPVRIARDGSVTPLASPAALPAVPGSITEVETTAEDGARVRGWLLLPEGASDAAPAPLLLWIHGGPAQQLERLELAVEPAARSGSRLRRAAARIPRSRPATASSSSPAAGTAGAASPTPTSCRSPTRSSRAPTSTRPAPRRWADPSAATWRTGSPGTPTGSARS